MIGREGGKKWPRPRRRTSARSIEGWSRRATLVAREQRCEDDGAKCTGAATKRGQPKAALGSLRRCCYTCSAVLDVASLAKPCEAASCAKPRSVQSMNCADPGAASNVHAASARLRGAAPCCALNPMVPARQAGGR
eukprot:12180518-Alexandrium_andersonii.AAC.1